MWRCDRGVSMPDDDPLMGLGAEFALPRLGDEARMPGVWRMLLRIRKTSLHACEAGISEKPSAKRECTMLVCVFVCSVGESKGGEAA